MTPTYDEFVTRNRDYVPAELQERLRSARVLIAGCGVGSFVAESFVRLGVGRLVLVDGDTVSASNLNRQNYLAADIGRLKVEALRDRLVAVNPLAQVDAAPIFLDHDSVDDLVAKCDIIFDTVDFLDLNAIVALHDAARRHGKPILTALTIGWGAGVLVFRSEAEASFRTLFDIPEGRDVLAQAGLYTVKFRALIERIGTQFPASVQHALAKALTVMEDGTPCPASQVAPGAFALASLAGTVLCRLLADEELVEAPYLACIDPSTPERLIRIALA